MENENNIKKIIDDLKITEEDLYFLSHIEGLKSTAGIFKEKYNKYMYGILKKYNTNSIDFLMISRYVKEKKLHLIPELIEKYGPYNIETAKTSFDYKGMKAFGVFLVIIVIGVVLFKFIDDKTKVDPCDCADIGSKVQIVGYQNLTSEQKKLYDACEKKYTTPAAAFEDCVESQMPKK